jgi:hypothetical protein
MLSPTHYRELAEELRYRACRTPDAEAREQLKVAARDYDEFARQAEEESEHERQDR